MRISEALLRYLVLNGVEHVFGIPAGTVSPIYDAMNDVEIDPIITKNEAGAAYSASRYACVSGRLGVCIVAGAVGINNMINGIADAMRAKAPVLVISGLVHRWQLGKGAIQELDTKEILRPVTKYSNTILDEEQVLTELAKAVQIAMTPPFGPVHLCIPVDIQGCEFTGIMPKRLEDTRQHYIRMDYGAMKRAADIINHESDGVIMVGKGCRGLSDKVMELSRHLQWPVITTPQGKGVIPGDFELNLGNFGFAGTDAAENYVENSGATCILVLGSSLGEPATGNFNNKLVEGRKIIHVDWDARELGKVFDTDVNVNCDLSIVIHYLISNTKKAGVMFHKPLINGPYVKNHTGLSTRLFAEKLCKIMPSDTCYVCDIGEYMNFVLKYLNIKEGGDFELNVNYGAMGSGIAGAPGVYLADKQRPVAVFAGDGSFLMNGMEILTAVEYQMPIVYFVFNNAMLGYVEHGHKYLYGRSVEGFRQKRISIQDMVHAMGIKNLQINMQEDMDMIRDAVMHLKGPLVVEIVIDGSEPAPILGRLKALKKVNA